MSDMVEERLGKMGIVLPGPAAPAANYVPFVLTGDMLYISGQLPMVDGRLHYTGKLGGGVSLEEGVAAAHTCALNILAQARAALGSLDKVAHVVKLGGFVNCTPDFTEHPKVINGASDLMGNVFGEAGRHARFAVGAPSLPLGAAVEIDAVLKVKG